MVEFNNYKIELNEEGNLESLKKYFSVQKGNYPKEMDRNETYSAYTQMVGQYLIKNLEHEDLETISKTHHDFNGIDNDNQDNNDSTIGKYYIDNDFYFLEIMKFKKKYPNLRPDLKSMWVEEICKKKIFPYLLSLPE